MATDENGEKTEQPSDRRREESRQQGNVARSNDLNAAVLLFAVALALQFWGASLIIGLAEMLSSYLSSKAWLQIDSGMVVREFGRLGMALLTHLFPILVLFMVSSLLVNVAQVGFHITTEPLQPKLSRINPISGLQRLFSAQGLVKLGTSLGKLVALTSAAAWFLWIWLGSFLQLADAPVETSAALTGSALIQLAYLLSIVLIILALADYAFQYLKFEKDIRMTKQEVRDEMRQMEGDPLIRQRRREAHRKLSVARQMQQVPNADVVVTNPTHFAVAIKYDAEKMAAPIVVAKGQDELAARIRRIAAEHGVPIIEKKELARALYKSVKVGHPVPIELYEVVAEILAYVYRLNGKAAA